MVALKNDVGCRVVDERRALLAAQCDYAYSKSGIARSGMLSRPTAEALLEAQCNLSLQQNCSRCSYRRIDVDVEDVVVYEDERRRRWSSSIRCRR